MGTGDSCCPWSPGPSVFPAHFERPPVRPPAPQGSFPAGAQLRLLMEGLIFKEASGRQQQTCAGLRTAECRGLHMGQGLAQAS